MPIIACGLNHKTAPIALRERLVFPAEKLPLYLQDLQQNENIREALILSTCNRSELYCDTDQPEKCIQWFADQHQVNLAELKPAWYCHEGQQAIEHIMQVACGLDSMVLGESQILGQMKEAFSESCANGSVNSQFNRLFQHVFAVAKEVRTNTAIGGCPVSIATAAINLAKKIFNRPLAEANVLLIGAGDTIRLVLNHLQHSVNKLTIANRNLEHAVQLAATFSADSIPLTQLSAALTDTDIVIAATNSPMPVLTKNLLKTRAKPIVIIDIAVPRDVEPAVAELADVKLYSIDDLKNIISHNLHGREHAAEQAFAVIKHRSNEFITWLQSLDQVALTISTYRKQVAELCETELNKALRQLQRGEDPTQVLSVFAHAFMNKMLHYPSVQLRQAGIEGRLEMLELAQQLFAVPESQSL